MDILEEALAYFEQEHAEQKENALKAQAEYEASKKPNAERLRLLGLA